MFRVFVSGLLLVLVQGQSWDSPCPRLFNYESYIDDTWSGILTLKIEKEIFNLNLNVFLDKLPLDFQSDFGRVALENSSKNIAEYSIIEPRYIASNSKIQIRITVKFNPQDPVPFLAGFKFNDQVICPEGGKIKIQQWQKPEITAFETPRKVSKRIIPEKEETWESPCPGLFRYQPEVQKSGEWTGVVTVAPEEDLGGIWVRLVFDGVPVNVETDLGTIDLKPTSFPNASEYLIRKTNERLQAGQKRDIKITVTYDEIKQVPLLVGFRLNARPVCPDVGIIDPNIFQRPKIWTPTKLTRKKNREFISPCPKWFSYRLDPKKPGEWVGVVVVVPEEDLGGVWIRLVLDSVPKNIESNFGLVTQKDSTFQHASEFLIRKTNEKVSRGQKLHLNFTVKYDEAGDPPLLVGFRLNARPVCPEDGIIDPDRVITSLELGASLQKLAMVEQMDNRIHMSNQGRNFTSPCPERFSYQVSRKEGEWIGTIILLPEDGSEWIHMAFKTKPKTLVTDFGMVLEKEPTLEGVSEYLIHRTKEGLNVTFTVKYDQKNDPPLLLGFRLNDKLVCPEDGIIDPDRIQFSGKRQNDSPMGVRLMDQEVFTEVPENSSEKIIEDMLQSSGVTGNEVKSATENVWKVPTWSSPCPERFSYVSSRPGGWIGSVTVNSEEPLNEVILHLVLTSRPKSLQTSFGEVTQNSSEFVIKSGVGFPKGQIRFNITVRYEEEQELPLLVSFRQNSRQVCPKSVFDEITEDPFEVPDVASTKIPQYLVSPCPKLFSYSFEKVGQWVGVINLITEENFNGIWIRLVLDTKPKTIETNYGLISPKDSSYKRASEFLIKKTNAKLLLGDTLRLNFTVTYDPKDFPPILVGFRLNARPICPENGIIDPDMTFRRNMSAQTTPNPDNETPADEVTPETPTTGTTADGVFTNAEDNEGNLDWGHLFDDFMNLNTPCPHRFLYVFDGEPGKWTGVVTLTAEDDIKGVNFRLLLDSQPKDLDTDFGQVTTLKAIKENRAEYLFQDPNQNLSKGDSLNFNFTIDYDISKPTPKVVAFTLNEKIMCPHNEIIRNAEGQLVTIPNQDFTWSPGFEKSGPEGLDKSFRGDEQKLRVDEVKMEAGGVCSDIFSPLPLKEKNRWYGIITWKPAEELDHISIDVILDREAQQLGNWFGEVTTLDNIHYTIKKTKPIHVWDVLKVRFFIKYNPDLASPNLKEIRINDKVICQAKEDVGPSGTSGPMTILEAKFPEGDLQNGTLLLQRDYITVWKYDTFTDIKIKNNLPGGKIPIIILR